ncbi:MAG TPA: hypothetical protein VGL56_05095 [Fimbriimonadaceae bacterium]|jgi:hypothetical protein
MNYEHLPSNIEQGVQQFAEQNHISHDEAVLLLIETGINAVHASEVGTMATPQERKERHELVTELRRKKGKGPNPPLSTDNPESVIGLFADRPDIVDSILQVVEERALRYTDPGK